MSSVAQFYFPLVRWKQGEKYLWNPIHRKLLKNRPEERVRLRILEFLMAAGWSRYRISTEESIKGQETDAGLRTDVVCYNQEFEPQILIECKAENVSISQKTAEQIARYNRNVGAPYLLLSNGNEDFWYQIDAGGIHSLPEMPDLLQSPEAEPVRGFDYWKARGFAGEQAIPRLRLWLEDIVPYFCQAKGGVTYLPFKKRPADLDISHYYHIRSIENAKVAFSFLNTPYGGSRLVGILNRDGVNRSVIEINMDLVFNDERPNASVYSNTGVKNIDVFGELAGLIQDMNATTYETLPAVLRRLLSSI